MNAIPSSLEDFTELLRQEIETYTRMVPLLEEEKQALSTADLEGLKENNKRIETLLMEVRILEEARKGMVERFAAELNLDAGELTLSRLIEAVDEPFAALLLNCREALTLLLEVVGKLVDRNASLIDYSFRANNSLILFLGSCITEDPTYSSAGTLKGKAENKHNLLAWRA